VNESINIIGGRGIGVTRFGDSWLIEFDDAVIPGPAAANADAPLDCDRLAILAYSDEHGELPDNDSWNRESDLDKSGVSITIQTGTCYDHQSDRVFYAFARDLTFNSDGQLVNVSAERRHIVDEPEAV
jgi:hypothetical protein